MKKKWVRGKGIAAVMLVFVLTGCVPERERTKDAPAEAEAQAEAQVEVKAEVETEVEAQAETEVEADADADAEDQARNLAAYQALVAQGMYYVKASGNDINDGLSEETAFQTLSRAVNAARSGTINAVTVIGELNQASERGNGYAVFDIDSEYTPVLITGIPYAPEGRRAVLSAQGTGKGGVNAEGTLRFEHLTISGAKTGLRTNGFLEITLGTEARVTGNDDGGVLVMRYSAFVLDGGTIENNKNSEDGAGVSIAGAFTMKRGTIRNNTATGEESLGGGVDVSADGTFILESGTIENNKCSGNGAGVSVTWGNFTMKRGTIRNNTATGEESLGGGVYFTSDDPDLTGRSMFFVYPVFIEGGVISGNKAANGAGVYLGRGELTLSGGSISGNTATIGGGVLVNEAATLIQSGGSISGNTAIRSGGGVFVVKDGTLTQSDGTISGNTAPDGADIYRDRSTVNKLSKQAVIASASL